MIYDLDDRKVETDGDNYWIAPNASVIGSVKLEKNASVWFGAVIRGDNDQITIGEDSNIQDNAVLHTDPGIPLVVGKNVTVGHLVMMHGCTIGDNSLVGIGSTILNNAKIGKNSIVGANALITEGKEFPDGVMILGSPGKIVRELSPQEIKFREFPSVYVQNAQRFKAGLREA